MQVPIQTAGRFRALSLSHRLPAVGLVATMDGQVGVAPLRQHHDNELRTNLKSPIFYANTAARRVKN
jgi:hypothetical protein